MKPRIPHHNPPPFEQIHKSSEPVYLPPLLPTHSIIGGRQTQSLRTPTLYHHSTPPYNTTTLRQPVGITLHDTELPSTNYDIPDLQPRPTCSPLGKNSTTTIAHYIVKNLDSAPNMCRNLNVASLLFREDQPLSSLAVHCSRTTR